MDKSSTPKTQNGEEATKPAEVVELGDAKALTKGMLNLSLVEANPARPTRSPI